jgi:hypothetical protein
VSQDLLLPFFSKRRPFNTFQFRFLWFRCFLWFRWWASCCSSILVVEMFLQCLMEFRTWFSLYEYNIILHFTCSLSCGLRFSSIHFSFFCSHFMFGVWVTASFFCTFRFIWNCIFFFFWRDIFHFRMSFCECAFFICC